MIGRIIHYLLLVVLWVPLIGFSLLLTHNALLYFTHGGEYGILPEKLVARTDVLWNAAFYIHLPFGILCLLLPLLSFSKRLFKTSTHFHSIIGRAYVWITVCIVCPTGMYLALYAKGGLITQIGFMIQGVLLALFTWRGYKAIQSGEKVIHMQAMIRSYAVATVVLSFRIFHILFFILRVPYGDNYAISQWLGLTTNLLLAEIIILYISIKKHRSLNIKSKYYEAF
jgi:hypothetical protein